MSAKRFVVAGSLTRDRIVRPDSVAEQIGGVPWYAGTSLLQLGQAVTVVTRLGAEDGFLAAALEERGADVLVEPAPATTTFTNHYTGARLQTRQQAAGPVAPPITGDHLSRAFDGADVLYFGPLHPGDLSPDVWGIAADSGVAIVALDAQGYTRRIRDGQIVAEAAPNLPTAMTQCSIVKADEQEAALITGERDPAAAARALATDHPGLEAVVTLGLSGAHVAAGGEFLHQRAFPVATDDPTGAGDMFFAAYLCRRANGASYGEAAAFAAAHVAERLRDETRFVRLASGV